MRGSAVRSGNTRSSACSGKEAWESCFALAIRSSSAKWRSSSCPRNWRKTKRRWRDFLAEAKSVGKLNHANVVSIYDIGQEGHAYFIVMELMPGGSVADGLDQQRPCSVLEATRIAIDACKGLAAAHAVGLIHRDMKPANLMKAAEGSVKITDFGLAKTTSPRTREITQAGLVVGTPYL